MPSPTHEPEVRLADIAAMIRSASDGIEARDRRMRALEGTLNDLMKQVHRPRGGNAFGDTDERAQAIGLLETKHFNAQTKHDPSAPAPSFSEDQVSEAKLAIAGLRTLMHSTSIDQLRFDERKALSAFSFGSLALFGLLAAGVLFGPVALRWSQRHK
jgi:hypothetical protein